MFSIVVEIMFDQLHLEVGARKFTKLTVKDFDRSFEQFSFGDQCLFSYYLHA